MNRTLVAALALSFAVPTLAQQAAPAANPYLTNVPISAGPMVLPISPGGRGTRPYEMSRIIPPEEKA
jgi:Spy/CpxP family protein refolding chaperone